MRKRWVFGGVLVLAGIFAGMSALYLEGDQFDRAVDGRTRTLAPGVTVTSHVLSSSLFSREVEAILKIQDKVFAQWVGTATLGFHINLTLTPHAKSPMLALMKSWGVEGYTDTVHVIAAPLTKNLTLEVLTPALRVQNDWMTGDVGAGRFYITKQGQMYSGNASFESTHVTIDGVHMGFGSASNQFAFLAPQFFQDSRLVWTVNNLEVSKKRPIRVGTFNLEQQTIAGDTFKETPLFNQSLRWKAQNVDATDRGSFALAQGEVVLQNVPLASWSMLENLYEGVKSGHGTPLMKNLFEKAGMAVVVEPSELVTGSAKSTWSGVLRYAPVMGGPAQWGWGEAQLDLSSFEGFDYTRKALAQWAKKGWIQKTDTGYDLRFSWDKRGVHTPKHVIKRLW